MPGRAPNQGGPRGMASFNGGIPDPNGAQGGIPSSGQYENDFDFNRYRNLLTNAANAGNNLTTDASGAGLVPRQLTMPRGNVGGTGIRDFTSGGFSLADITSWGGGALAPIGATSFGVWNPQGTINTAIPTFFGPSVVNPGRPMLAGMAGMYSGGAMAGTGSSSGVGGYGGVMGSGVSSTSGFGQMMAGLARDRSLNVPRLQL